MDGVSFDVEEQGDDVALEDGINAYVAASKDRDIAKRGQRGKIKFSNRKNQEDDDMDIDEDDVVAAVQKKKSDGFVKGRGDCYGWADLQA
jgi:ribosomal RNA-processing protein 12